jgi:hypothetical protein
MSGKNKKKNKQVQFCQKTNFHNTKLPDRDTQINKKIDNIQVNSQKPKPKK